MLFSILISAIPERYHSVQPLLYALLESQSVARRPDVELCYLLDNRRRSVGAKRNALLDMARGEYVAFIDDDDLVASDYVDKVYRAIVQARKADPPADVICFRQHCTIEPGGMIHDCTYSLAHFRDRPPDQRRQLAQTATPGTLAWSGPPAHTMAWRRATIGDTRFSEKNFGEDVDWVDALCAKAKSEIVLVGEPLYFYRFDQAKTATRG